MYASVNSPPSKIDLLAGTLNDMFSHACRFSYRDGIPIVIVVLLYTIICIAKILCN